MKKYLFIILLFHCSTKIYSQEIPMNFSFFGGINVSHLNIDTVTTTKATQPIIGINYLVPINDKLSFKLGISTSNRGSNEESPIIKHRVNYIDLIFMPTFKLFDNFYIEAGGQYSILYNSYDKILDSTSPTGERKDITEGYKSQPEFYVGIDFQLEKTVHIGCRYMLPLDYIPYTNFQVTTNIYVDPVKLGDSKQISTSIEDAIINSNTVTKLVLQRKKLKSIPYEIFSMPNLEELILNGNEITKIPKEIGQLKKLKYLSVKHNQIETLPSEIGQLQNLERLELAYNNLQTIPPELCYLPKLGFLMIGKNSISFLPNEIGNLESLIELDIANSGRMIQVPTTLSQIRGLEFLYVDQTAIIPNNILNNPRTIYNYIENDENSSPESNTYVNPSRYLKIIIVSMF